MQVFVGKNESLGKGCKQPDLFIKIKIVKQIVICSNIKSLHVICDAMLLLFAMQEISK
jgi:hypothetical protein